MIPKKIHYCWFGGNPLPENVKRCIDSWKKYCSEYEIIEWNENNYDVKKNGYLSKMYSEKKYAFVS
ncbi:TPA: glycosyltransferase family 32 protein, partial [Streptococcus suis]